MGLNYSQETTLNLYNQIKDISVDNMIRRGKDFDFVEIEKELRDGFNAVELATKVTDFWYSIPRRTVEQYVNAINVFATAYLQIAQFKPTVDNPTAERTNIINNT